MLKHRHLPTLLFVLAVSVTAFSVSLLLDGKVVGSQASAWPDAAVQAQNRFKANLRRTVQTLNKGYAYNADGSVSWTLVTRDGFRDSEVTGLGGTIKFKDAAKNIVIATSRRLDFGDRIVVQPHVKLVKANYKRDFGKPVMNSAVASANTGSAPAAGIDPSVDPDKGYVNGYDAYRENGQWPLYAIDAADPVPSNGTTVSGWTPEWKLKKADGTEYDGSGVTVGDFGGMPGVACDTLDIKVDISVTGSGLCAIRGDGVWGGASCFVWDGEAYSIELTPEVMCGIFGEAAGNAETHFQTINGVATCVLPNHALTALEDFFGFPFANGDGGLSGFFRPYKLHPEADWYITKAEAAANSSLGQPGGVVPIFNNLEQYRAYYQNRAFTGETIPLGLEILNEQFSGVELTFSLSPETGALIESGGLNTCATADPRLTDPDSLIWKDYNYRLWDQPFDKEGYWKWGGQNGYDQNGELRAIIDPNIVFGQNLSQEHALWTVGVMAARYRPDHSGEVKKFGAMRGIAPGAKYIGYPDSFDTYIGLLAVLRRAADDGVDIMSVSWHADTFLDKKLVKGNPHVSSEELYDMSTYANPYWNTGLEQAEQGLFNRTLLVAPGSGDNAGLDYAVTWPGETSIWLKNPKVLTVFATAPRDYDWKGNIPEWMPDAPGKPYDSENKTKNLDRPMLARAADGQIAMCGGFDTRVDVAAPGGSWMEEYQPNELNNLYYVLGSQSISIGYHNFTAGTSLAVPTVAGVATLAAQAYKETHGGHLPSPDQLHDIIVSTADDLVGPTVDDVGLMRIGESGFLLHFGEDGALAETASYEEQIDYAVNGLINWEWVTGTKTIDIPGHDAWMGAGRVNAYKAILRAMKK